MHQAEGPRIGPSGWRSADLSSAHLSARRTPRRRPRSGALVTVLVVVAVTAGLLMIRDRVAMGLDGVRAKALTGQEDRPRAAAGSAGRLIPAPTAPGGTGGFAFIAENPLGPAAYDPCRPLAVVVNNEVVVPGADALIGDALALVQEASGLQLVYEGATDELANPERRTMDAARYGERWSPVLIAWTTPERDAELAGEVAGVAGSAHLVESTGRLTNVTGAVHLDAPTFAQILQQPNGRPHAVAIVMHELAHVLGLGHVDSSDELMAPSNSGQVAFGDGDRRGLALLADRPCAVGL